MFAQVNRKWLPFLFFIFSVAACEKKDNLPNDGHLQQTKTFSSDVVVRWLNQQLKMFRLPLATGASAPAADRAFAYSGIALYEAVVPGMPSYRSLGGQLAAFPQMPATEPGKAYHWAASANAALAAISRSLFPGASPENKDSMNVLEAELQAQYAKEVDTATLQRSIRFGQTIAQAVWAWAQGDGTAVIASQPAYTIPVGTGLWTKEYTPAPAANPYHALRRQMVAGSREGAAAPVLPIPFSTDPASPFYAMAKEVYDLSQSLTDEQRNIAFYHREGFGFGGGSSIAGQLAAVLTQFNARLDKAAVAFAKVGIGSYEALTLTFIQKYSSNFLVMRPITYIRSYMGHAAWTTLFTTPPYPEYPAGHPTNGGMLSVMLASEFGTDFSFNVNYYSYLNQPARHYDNFEALAQEMAIARVYAGIHYKPAVYAGLALGKKVAQNILSQLHFQKE
ncbi:MAG TPA: vanadium-dependent haloperoxidase [Flavisolibacter sp.]|nr:vanadium-dependent haloperoxidase [Flavisolibacter sp.]